MTKTIFLLVALIKRNQRERLLLGGAVFIHSTKFHAAVIDDAFHLIVVRRTAALQGREPGLLHEITALLTAAGSTAHGGLDTGGARVAGAAIDGDDVLPALAQQLRRPLVGFDAAV